MEAKLAAYRANKAKQRQTEQSFYNRLKVRLLRGNNKSQNAGESCKEFANGGRSDNQVETESRIPDQNASYVINETREVEESTTSETVTKWILRLCKLALWFCLWGLFIELQFGAVFFAVSAIVFTYINTRTGPGDGKLSAYSVFNKDCERIQGTITAEQMQKSMFGIPGVTS